MDPPHDLTIDRYMEDSHVSDFVRSNRTFGLLLFKGDMLLSAGLGQCIVFFSDSFAGRGLRCGRIFSNKRMDASRLRKNPQKAMGSFLHFLKQIWMFEDALTLINCKPYCSNFLSSAEYQV